jgi:hypothetical protein
VLGHRSVDYFSVLLLVSHGVPIARSSEGPRRFRRSRGPRILPR